MKRLLFALAGLSLVTQQAVAGIVPIPQPVQVGEETGRYMRGVPVSSLELKNGAISVTPLPLDHGSYAFQVVVYNDGTMPANFDVSDVTATGGAETLTPFSVDELASAAKTRAMWTQIGIAMLAGAAAVAVANASTTNTDYGRLRTPHGTYSWVNSYRDNTIGVVGAAASVGAGVAGISSIQSRLDATLGMLDETGIQRTTVEPAASYGGRIVLRKFKNRAQQDVKLAINWNGETYLFAYHMPKKGEPNPPSLRAATAPSRAARGYEPAVLQQPASPSAQGPVVVPAASAPAPVQPGGPAASQPKVTPAALTAVSS